MIMKASKILSLAAALLCIAACKGPNANLRGSYTFKTGGYLDIKGKVYEIERDTVKIDTTITERTIGRITYKDTSYRYTIKNDTLSSRDTQFVRHLVAESGQMHVVQAGDDMKLTLNITGGGAVVYNAKGSGDRISLSPTKRKVSVSPNAGTSDSDQSVSFLFDTGGEGQLYENMLLFRMNYEGKYSYRDMDGDIRESHIDCIALRNE